MSSLNADAGSATGFHCMPLYVGTLCSGIHFARKDCIVQFCIHVWVHAIIHIQVHEYICIERK